MKRNEADLEETTKTSAAHHAGMAATEPADNNHRNKTRANKMFRLKVRTKEEDRCHTLLYCLSNEESK